MMKRLLIERLLTVCNAKCNYKYREMDGRLYCSHPSWDGFDKYIFDTDIKDGFPTWCPLEDVVEI